MQQTGAVKSASCVLYSKIARRLTRALDGFIAASVNDVSQNPDLAIRAWERNGRAQAFYRKWDFRAVGEHVFQLGSDPQRDILMDRTL